MEHLSTSLSLEEVPVPGNTIDIQSDDHLQVPSMFLVSFHCILGISVCVHVCVCLCSCNSINCKIPGKIPKRGRCKGSELTVIGIPKQKKLTDRPVAVLKQHPEGQERGSCNDIRIYSYISIIFSLTYLNSVFVLGMLKWFLSVPDANKGIKDGILLDKASIEMRYEKVPNACIDVMSFYSGLESISLTMDGYNCHKLWR